MSTNSKEKDMFSSNFNLKNKERISMDIENVEKTSSQNSTINTENKGELTKSTEQLQEKPKKCSKKRCNHPDCRKKLKLTDVKCRCGLTFCYIHRYSDKHNCQFDYKTFGRKQLDANNPVVDFAKIEQI